MANALSPFLLLKPEIQLVERGEAFDTASGHAKRVLDRFLDLEMSE